jgi:heptosyltransferase I
MSDTQQNAIFSNAPNSICVLRLSALGDVCNAIATVQAIQSYWPSTKITWIVGTMESHLVKSLPNIEVLVFDKKKGVGAYKALWKELRSKRFDALLHMQYSIRASLVSIGVKARYKLGFDRKRSQDFQTLFTNVKVSSPLSPHVADGLRAFAVHLGVPPKKLEWSIPYTEADKLWALKSISQSEKTVVIVPGASKSYKNWTPEGYAKVIAHAKKQGLHVVLAGSPSQVELDLVEKILDLTSDCVVNLVGKSTITQMLALIAEADAVISPDTGPAHIASAMGTPVLSLYAHHNPKRVSPYNFQHYVVSVYEEALAEEHTKPITELNWRTRVQDEHAMQRIQVAQVLETFDKLIDSIS